MEPFNTNQNPVAAGSQMPVSPGGSDGPKPQHAHKPVGPIAGAIIIIVLLVAGGLYFYGAQLNRETADQMPYIPSDDYMMPEGSMPAGELQSDTSAGLPPQSDSDDVSSIQADMNAMDIDQMNSENSAEINNI